MDKKALRSKIREQKRAMTPAQIEEASSKLGEMFLKTELLQEASAMCRMDF